MDKIEFTEKFTKARTLFDGLLDALENQYECYSPEENMKFVKDSLNLLKTLKAMGPDRKVPYRKWMTMTEAADLYEYRLTKMGCEVQEQINAGQRRD